MALVRLQCAGQSFWKLRDLWEWNMKRSMYVCMYRQRYIHMYVFVFFSPPPCWGHSINVWRIGQGKEGMCTSFDYFAHAHKSSLCNRQWGGRQLLSIHILFSIFLSTSPITSPHPFFENWRNLKKAKDFCTPLLYDDCLEFWCWLGNEDVGWMDSGLYIQCLLYFWPILGNNMHTYVRRQSFHFFHFWQSTLLFCCCFCIFFWPLAPYPHLYTGGIFHNICYRHPYYSQFYFYF